MFCSASALNLHTDAAGSCGYGAFWNGHWSAALWHDRWKQKGFTTNVDLLELFSVLVALELCGVNFVNKRITLHSDNRGVVFSINGLSSESLPIIAILCQIVFKCLLLIIWIKVKFIPGVDNLIADALSHLQIQARFYLFIII